MKRMYLELLGVVAVGALAAVGMCLSDTSSGIPAEQEASDWADLHGYKVRTVDCAPAREEHTVVCHLDIEGEDPVELHCERVLSTSSGCEKVER